MHVVARGESLGRIADRYGVSVEQLRGWNQGLLGDAIRVGQELRIAPATGEEEAAVLTYRVVPGDTLGCIAQRYEVPTERLLEDNPHVSVRRLEVGQELRIRGGTDPSVAEPAAASARVTVEPGDTLSSIAARHGVSVEALRADNDLADPDVLPVGSELTVPVAAHVAHVVSEGETLLGIAARHGVEVEQILRDNPGLEPDLLRVGQELTLRGDHASASVGAPNCGHVVGSVQLGTHRAYVLRNPERSWATSLTARRIRAAFDRVRRAHPRAARVRVHDLSLRGGGPIDDHRSHQSGRDVDITYYQRRGCGQSGCPLRRVDPAQLDARRQWTLLRHWLRRDQVEAIYVDYALQEPLYREARRRGATAAQLREWFQYPRGRWHSEGRVRHFPNHRDHLHVRFACAEAESSCR